MLHCPECGQNYADGASACPADGAALRADVTSEGAADADELVGQTLDGKYRLDALLGEGGMGTVYRATHLLIDRPVAVKVLRPRFVGDDAAQHRFRREARAAGRLRHPNAVAVTDFGDTPEGYVYIVMELLEGRTLRELIADEGPLPAALAVRLMGQAAEAVAAAHEAGVIHRDLKPGNIFVMGGDNVRPAVKVLDFGIAKLAAESAEDSDAKNLTQTGVMIGTPRYMSPEQCDGDRLTPASDVYSLGVILYEMLTGVPPFNGPTPLAVALQHSSKPPRPPRELVPTIPAELERVVLHALAKSPGERPGDAGEFRRELLETAPLSGGAAAGGSRVVPALVVADAAAGDGNGRSVVTPSGSFVNGLGKRRGGVAEGGNGNGGGDRDVTGGDGSHVNDGGDAGASRVVVSVTPEDAESAGPNDTTIVARPSDRVRTGRAALGSAPAPKGSAIDLLFPLQTRAYTRFQVMLKRRGWPQRLAQPPVLIAALLALAVLSIITFGLISSRGVGPAQPAAVENAAPAATPEPTPEATATPSPTPAATNRQRGGQRANRAATNRQRKQQGGNPVKKVLKKIFKPF